MEITREKFLKLGAMAGAGLALPLGTLSVRRRAWPPRRR
jgi:hypothetical protein